MTTDKAVFLDKGITTFTRDGKTQTSYVMSFAVPYEYNPDLTVGCTCYINEDLYNMLVKEELQQGDVFAGIFSRSKGFAYKFEGFPRV